MPERSTRVRSRNGSAPASHRPTPRQIAAREPDVHLSVPDLHVDEIDLDVEQLEAHLALQARVANLLDLQAGAHVTIEKVQLQIKGVGAKATLKIHLDNVRAIVDRTLTTVDRNPDILDDAVQTVGTTVGRPAQVAERVRGAGRAARRVGLISKVATAAGLVAGAALVAHRGYVRQLPETGVGG